MDSLQISYDSARLITQHHAKTFYFASHTLSPDTRSDAYAIYAFCRKADDAVDLATSEQERKQAVHDFNDKLTQVFETQLFDHQKDPWIEAFSKTVHRHQIPRLYFEELLEGMVIDQGKVRFQTWQELDRYCYLVAGVVGIIMTHLFTKPTPELLEKAKDLGTAMQLTNILRDVQEDLERDRIYLPAEELQQWNLREKDLHQKSTSENWKRFMQFQINRARRYYDQSEEGIRGLPSGGIQKTVWLMRVIYSEILSEIEKQSFDVFQKRARVSGFRKLVLGMKTILMR